MRQRWNFTSPNTVREVEEFQVELSGVTVLELVIASDISRGLVAELLCKRCVPRSRLKNYFNFSASLFHFVLSRYRAIG